MTASPPIHPLFQFTHTERWERTSINSRHRMCTQAHIHAFINFDTCTHSCAQINKLWHVRTCCASSTHGWHSAIILFFNPIILQHWPEKRKSTYSHTSRFCPWRQTHKALQTQPDTNQGQVQLLSLQKSNLIRCAVRTWQFPHSISFSTKWEHTNTNTGWGSLTQIPSAADDSCVSVLKCALISSAKKVRE